jgi:hypothetical protein
MVISNDGGNGGSFLQRKLGVGNYFRGLNSRCPMLAENLK